MENLDESLARAARQFLGTCVHPVGWLEGGDQALVLRVDTSEGALVLHASPPWRTPEELHWVHSIAKYARARVPQAVAPLERQGKTTFKWAGRLVAVYPFVAGHFLDREDPVLRAEAAWLLAEIHRALSDFPGGPRPQPGAYRPDPPVDPAELHDPALDEWWTSIRTGLATGPTHGDYYRRNLLCAGRQIVGVIDWHEASVRPLALELAQATFELCRDGDHRFYPDRADEFVATYRSCGGPVPGDELGFLLPLIRVWIRDDVRWSLAFGASLSDEYVAKQIRAFRELAALDWKPA